MAEEVRLLEMLEEAGIITREQSQKAAEVIVSSPESKRIDEVLLEIGAITLTQRADLVELVYGLPAVDLSNYVPDLDAAKFLPEEIARKCNALPLFQEENELTVAIGDPESDKTIDYLSTHSDISIRPVFADWKQIKQAIPNFYQAAGTIEETVERVSKETVAAISADMSRVSQDSVIEVLQEALSETGILEQLAKDASTVALLHTILVLAAKKQASDIHIQPRRKNLQVRLRVNGSLEDSVQIPKHVYPPLIARFKLMAGLDLAETHKPQEGLIEVKIKDKTVKLNLSIVPTALGEKVVLRRHETDMSLLALHSIGFLEEEVAAFQSMLKKGCTGLIMVAGGKQMRQTALQAIAISLNAPDRNIMILDEKPTSFDMSETTLIEIDPEKGLNYSDLLDTVANYDPDNIIVNNLDDLPAVKSAMTAALDGHLIIGGVPTEDAASTIFQLASKLGDLPLVALSILGIVSQKWLHSLCSSCKTVEEAAVFESEAFKTLVGPLVHKTKAKGHPIIFKPQGCDKCNGKGYTGTISLTEVFPLTSRLRHAILEEADLQTIERVAQEENIETMRIKIARKVLEGVVDLEQAWQVIQRAT